MFEKFTKNNVLGLFAGGNCVIVIFKISESMSFTLKNDNRFSQSLKSVKVYAAESGGAALCLAAHSVQLFSAPEVNVSVAL